MTSIVNGSLVRIRSWSKIKSVSNVSFFHVVSAFFPDTQGLFISKITRTKVENGEQVCDGGEKGGLGLSGRLELETEWKNSF